MEVTCVCFQRRRVRHNANYVPCAQMPACPLWSICLESLQPHSQLQWRFRDKGLWEWLWFCTWLDNVKHHDILVVHNTMRLLWSTSLYMCYEQHHKIFVVMNNKIIYICCCEQHHEILVATNNTMIYVLLWTALAIAILHAMNKLWKQKRHNRYNKPAETLRQLPATVQGPQESCVTIATKRLQKSLRWLQTLFTNTFHIIR